MYRLFFKRLFDIILSLTILIVALPLLLVLSFINYIILGISPFFFQERIGKDEKRIKIVKFKSMTNEKDSKGILLPDNKRLTKIGAFARKTSLDELPQLINVLKGEMSLIGPRPLLPKYLPLYSTEQHRRHLVMPGITGWAQINGRNSISWTEKFKLDIYYVEKFSFGLDIKILFLTILKVIKNEGINQSADSPMKPFNGHN